MPEDPKKILNKCNDCEFTTDSEEEMKLHYAQAHPGIPYPGGAEHGTVTTRTEYYK